jgi:diguanylate cyclase (GGDEF)-like protein/PAS domain S-box-containing protein
MNSFKKIKNKFTQYCKLTPLSLSLFYILIALLWIFGSAYFLDTQVNDPFFAKQIELAKGVLFVLTTGGLFYLLLKNWHTKIVSATNQLQNTLDAIPDLLFEIDLEGHCHSFYSSKNDLFTSLPDMYISKTIHDFLPPDAVTISLLALHEANEQGFSYNKNIILPLPQGEQCFELSVSRKQDILPTILPHFIVIFRDITERTKAQKDANRMRDLYAALSQCNQAIVRCKNEDELFPLICQDAVTFGKMKMAWIGLVDEESNELKAVASAGDGTDYLQALRISIDPEHPSSHGPTGTAFREDRPFWCQDFIHGSATAQWHKKGEQFGWGASAAVPLHRNGVVVGILTLYAGEIDAFDESAQKLLLEMATDIDYALDNYARDLQQKVLENQLLKLSQAMEQSPNSIIITDFKGNIEYVNTVFMDNTGYTLSEVIGKNPRLLKSGNTPVHAYNDMWASLVRQEKWQGEFINKRKDGTNYIYSINVAPVLDTEGRTTHYIAIEEDISEQKKTQDKIHYLANYDVLTGLPNRIQMDEHLRYTLSLAKRNPVTFALIFLDLDHFKNINDTLGHSVGDLLLVELAKRLSDALRDEDTVSRMGGDEFVLLLPETDSNGAGQVAQKLLESIAQPFFLEGHELSVTASIGIALYPLDGSDIETLSKNADTAMYRSKQDGRNAYCFFTQQMQENSKRNLELSNALHSALERNEFHLVYQPQHSIKDGSIIGVEALIRWNHPILGSISPVEFISVAEDNGMILAIGEWVLRTAIQQTYDWNQKNKYPIIIAVNLSSVQFRHQNLLHMISQILNDIGLSPEHLELELTEGAAMHDPHAAIEIMNSLHNLGIRMSIDDFGTGYSSLSYLKKFKIYKLKIDQSFVRDLNSDPEDKAIVTAVIQLAHSLGLITIAEGVETIEQLEYLKQQQCDEIQGYHYSKPLLSEDFEAYIKTYQKEK